MTKNQSVETAFAKFSEGAGELLIALEIAGHNSEAMEIFNEVYDLPEEFSETVAAIQQMESEFLVKFRERTSKKGYVVFKNDCNYRERHHFCELEYFQEGFDVIIRDTISNGYATPEFFTWEEFTENAVVIPEAAYKAAETLLHLGLDVSSIAEELIKIHEDEQKELLKL